MLSEPYHSGRPLEYPSRPEDKKSIRACLLQLRAASKNDSPGLFGQICHGMMVRNLQPHRIEEFRMLKVMYWTCFVAAVMVLPACSTSPRSAVEADLATTISPEPIVRSRQAIAHRVAPNQQTSVQWLASGEHAYLGRITLSPNAEVPLHQHDSEEYLYILSGGGVMTIDGQQHVLEPDMVVFVPGRTPHSFVNGPEITEAVQVFASPEGAQRFLSWPESDTGISKPEQPVDTP
jgi:mannose-6-phosphate isomerase-like protein (cupin superfamily)